MNKLDTALKENEIFVYIKALDEFLKKTIKEKTMLNKELFQHERERHSNFYIDTHYDYTKLHITVWHYSRKVILIYYNVLRDEITNISTYIRMKNNYKQVNLKESTYIQSIIKSVEELGIEVKPLVFKARDKRIKELEEIENADSLKIVRSSNISQLFEDKKTL